MLSIPLLPAQGLNHWVSLFSPVFPCLDFSAHRPALPVSHFLWFLHFTPHSQHSQWSVMTYLSLSMNYKLDVEKQQVCFAHFYTAYLMRRVDSLEKILMLGLGAGGQGDDRGWDGWMASLTRWTWVWVNAGSWWWTGRPGVLRFMGSQRVGHNWATKLTDRLILPTSHRVSAL